MSAYYNEHDPHAAAWLRNLITAGLIAPGDVDERDIRDVRPNDLRGYTQCHFFAGIGVWSYALRRAGWPDHRRVWTGSCPCQPFSSSGKGLGFADERHLWPAFHHLIAQCRPDVVFGEQVTSKDGLAWIDLVQSDMEGTNYAFGKLDLCAAGFGAPHIRQRLYWVADSDRDGRNQEGQRVAASWCDGTFGNGAAGILVDGERARLEGQRRHGDNGRQSGWLDAIENGSIAEAGVARGLADDPFQRSDRPLRARRRRDGSENDRSIVELADNFVQQQSSRKSGAGIVDYPDGRQQGAAAITGLRDDLRPGPTNGHWRDADWLFCRDGKWRPVRPGSFPLVDGAPGRVGRLRAYGNAIVAAQAEEYIGAYLDYESDGILLHGDARELTLESLLG